MFSLHILKKIKYTILFSQKYSKGKEIRSENLYKNQIYALFNYFPIIK